MTTPDSITITLQLPHKALMPNNGRPHWRVLQREKKAATLRAFVAARNDHGIDNWHWSAAELHPTFYWKTKARHDKDNANASLKAHIDGICNHAGLLVDDSQLIPFPPKFEVDKNNPRVELTFVKRNTAVADGGRQ